MSSKLICSICCDIFTFNSVVQATKCGHLFHEDCIQRWLNSKSTCPDCRQGSQLLNRIYLNFDDCTEEITQLNTTINALEKLEKLVLELSHEEAKRKTAEKLVQENATKLHQQSQIAKKKEEEHQKLLISYQEVKLLLKEEKRLRCIAEEAKDSLSKELNALKQTSVKKSNQIIDLTNVRRKETPNVTIRIMPNTRLQAPASVSSCRSRNGLSNHHSDEDEKLVPEQTVPFDAQQEIENLILKLSLDEEKYETVKRLQLEREKNQREHSEMVKEKEREQQKLLNRIKTS